MSAFVVTRRSRVPERLVCVAVFSGSVFDNERGRYVMTQNNHMLRLLGDYELKTMNQWQDAVGKQIPQLLRMNLLARLDALMLLENFHDDVR